MQLPSLHPTAIQPWAQITLRTQCLRLHLTLSCAVYSLRCLNASTAALLTTCHNARLCGKS